MASSALVRLVAATVADLETLLAHDHVEQGREVMRALVTDIRLRPMPSNGQRQLEAVIQAIFHGYCTRPGRERHKAESK